MNPIATAHTGGMKVIRHISFVQGLDKLAASGTHFGDA
jgi:hypothetical protein